MAGLAVGWRVRLILVTALAGGVVLGATATGDGYLIHLVDLAAVYAVVAMSLNLLIGISGQISLSHAAFFGIGAYTTAILATTAGWPFWATVGVSLVAGAIGGLGLGLPALRLRGHYLGMVTLGFGQIVSIVLMNWVSVTGGANGIANVPPPTLLGASLGTDRSFLPLAVGSVAVVYLVLHMVERSTYGLRLKAIRDDDVAAASIGVSIRPYKLLAFVGSSVIAAMAGSLFVGFLGVASPESFGIGQSILFLVMVVVGGLGSIGGSILGAVAVTFTPEYLRALDSWYRFAFGAAVVLVAMFLPRGLAGLAELAVARGRRYAKRTDR